MGSDKMNEEDIKYNEVEDLDCCLKLLLARDKEIELLKSEIKERDNFINNLHKEIEKLEKYCEELSKRLNIQDKEIVELKYGRGIRRMKNE